MKKLLILLILVLMTGCAQFAPKATYQVENCDRTYQWDAERQRDVITFESCTKSNVESNRESKNIVLKSNQKSGQLDFSAGELTNAEETAWAKALAEILSDPEAVQAGFGILRTLLTGQK